MEGVVISLIILVAVGLKILDMAGGEAKIREFLKIGRKKSVDPAAQYRHIQDPQQAIDEYDQWLEDEINRAAGIEPERRPAPDPLFEFDEYADKILAQAREVSVVQLPAEAWKYKRAADQAKAGDPVDPSPWSSGFSISWGPTDKNKEGEDLGDD